jgi:L-asparaginase II
MASVIFSRGGYAESAHHFLWCTTKPDGAVDEASGDDAPGLDVFARSASKPLQALPAVRAGVLERYGLGDRHLAIACASHGGAAEHVAAVSEILEACGATEDDLGCGPSDPRAPAAADAARARGDAPRRIVHNCSGKHALGLALCAQKDWVGDHYWIRSHPLQHAMRDAVAQAVGAPPEAVPHGVDGCGMLAFQVPLAGLAGAFGRLASGRLGEAGDRVAGAMRAHPGLVAYEGAIDTELMAADDALVAKVGAEGVLAVGLADGRGLAVKVLDGGMRALDPAGVALVREVLGRPASNPALDELARPVVRSSRGEAVGEGVARI